MVRILEKAPFGAFFIDMKVLLGTKEGMSQVFDDNGKVHPVTVLSVAQNFVTQVKTQDTDTYEAVQIASGKKSKNQMSKAVLGHLKDAGPLRTLKEFRTEGKDTEYKVGDVLDASIFEEGDKVKVSSVSKGKGFQGTVKRHNFGGGPRSHGQKHTERAPGSIGAKGPARVFKGRKMPGRTGGDRVTVKNLQIVKVDTEAQKLYIRGAIPGPKGVMVEVVGV